VSGFAELMMEKIALEARIRELEADLKGWLDWYWDHANGRSAKTRELLLAAAETKGEQNEV
jgi:hypothetical protein